MLVIALLCYCRGWPVSGGQSGPGRRRADEMLNGCTNNLIMLVNSRHMDLPGPADALISVRQYRVLTRLPHISSPSNSCFIFRVRGINSERSVGLDRRLAGFTSQKQQLKALVAPP